jgi:hypothetical protein
LRGVALPGNDNTAANSRVAVLSKVGGLGPKTVNTATSVVAAVLIRRLPGSLARGAFQMIVFGRAGRRPTQRRKFVGPGGAGFVDGWRKNADPTAF